MFHAFAPGLTVSFLCGTCCSDWRSHNEEGFYRQEFRCQGRDIEKDDRGGQSGRTHPFFCKPKIPASSLMATDQQPVYSLYNATSVSTESFSCHSDLRACVLQVCATLGTTSSCAFDRITELGPICELTIAVISSFSHIVGGFYHL